MTHPATTPAAGGDAARHALILAALLRESFEDGRIPFHVVRMAAVAVGRIWPEFRLTNAKFGERVARKDRVTEKNWRSSETMLDKWTAANPNIMNQIEAALSAPSPAAGTTGVVPAGWSPNFDYDNEATWPPRSHALYGLFHDARLLGGWQAERFERIVRHFYPLAAAPEAPTPVTSAPGAEGGEDLAGLSARATPGEWGVADKAITTLPAGIGTGIATECGMHDNWFNNRAYIVALVKDHREGRLVAAVSNPNEKVIVQDPLIKIAPDARKDKEPCGECRIRPGETCDICGAKCAAPTPAPVAQGEPVAWAYEHLAHDGSWVSRLLDREPDNLSVFRNIRPLYAAPAAPRSADLPGREAEDDAEIDRILALSGDELRAELVAEGHDPDEMVRKERLGLDGLLRLAADREKWRSEAASWRRVAERLEEEKGGLREALKPFAAILANGEPVGPIPRGFLDSKLTRQDLRRATAALTPASPTQEMRAAEAPAALRSGTGVTVEEVAEKARQLREEAKALEEIGSYTGADEADAVAKAYEECLALLQARRPGEAEDGWEPIETAPTDRPIAVRMPSKLLPSGWFVTTAWLPDPDDDDNRLSGCSTIYNYNGEPLLTRFRGSWTHWRDDAPPAQGEDRGGEA